MSLISNMKILKWLTFTVLFTVSLSFSIETFESTFEDSTSESTVTYGSTVEDFTSESPSDYNLIEEDFTSKSSFDYEPVFKDSTPENAFESSVINNLLYPPDDRNCPVHEHWEFCTGLCQRNCSNWSKALICPDICVQGCLCDWGFTRGPEGNCIPVSGCPPIQDGEPIKINVQYKCRRNEHFSACGGHEECQKDCSNYDEDIPCVASCEPGCVCNEGFVRGRSGKCIPIEQCPIPYMRSTFQSKKPLPKLCGSHEHFSACNGLPRCQKSCSNYNETIICPTICVPGCVCDRGYVIGPSGECVPLEECTFEIQSASTQGPRSRKSASTQEPDQTQTQSSNSLKSKFKEYEMFSDVTSADSEVLRSKSCPIDEHYSPCRGYRPCQKTCKNYDETIVCPLPCYPGCVCDYGFVRGPIGKCISLDRCPPRVKSSLLQVTSKMVEPNQAQPQPFNSWKSESKDYEISSEDPPTDSEVLRPAFCQANEHFSECNGYESCQKTCTNYDAPIIICPKMCISGCVCDDGFVKAPNGRCIPLEQCPLNMRSNSLQEPKQSQSSNKWNLGFEHADEEFSDIPSTDSEDFHAATDLPSKLLKTPDCPDESKCDWKCKTRGFKYGVCIGYQEKYCSCFE